MLLCLHSINLYLLAVTSDISKCIVEPVRGWLFELESKVFKPRAFELLVELISSLSTKNHLQGQTQLCASFRRPFRSGGLSSADNC